MKEHWDKVYTESEDFRLSWYEEFPAPAVELLEDCKINKNDRIVIAGAGTTSFVNYLSEQNYSDIIVTDISTAALEKLKDKLKQKLKDKLKDKSKEKVSGKAQDNIKFIADDLTEPTQLLQLSDVTLWYDRAVLHFFVNESARLNYFSLIKKLVKKHGYVILAEFSLSGPDKCSGLDVIKYNDKMLLDGLGRGFKLLRSFDYLYYTPPGAPRPYIYTLFQKL